MITIKIYLSDKENCSAFYTIKTIRYCMWLTLLFFNSPLNTILLRKINKSRSIVLIENNTLSKWNFFSKLRRNDIVKN